MKRGRNLGAQRPVGSLGFALLGSILTSDGLVQ